MYRKNFIKHALGNIFCICMAWHITDLTARTSGAGLPIPSVTLKNGRKMPMLGTYTPKGDTAMLAVKTALRLGYRHLDMAQAYGNEKEVYEEIRQNEIERKEVFITTKVSPQNTREHRIEETLEESLKTLKGESIDPVLIHFPVRGKGLIRKT